MDRVEKDGDRALVSTLVILEIIGVIRKRITERENFLGLTDDVKAEIKKKIEDKTREFTDKITRLARQGKVLIVNPEKTLDDYLKNTLAVLSPHFGEIWYSDYCFTCRRNIPERYRYQEFGHYDIQHAINARDCSGDEIVSFDRGIAQLQGVQEFDSIRVTVL